VARFLTHNIYIREAVGSYSVGDFISTYWNDSTLQIEVDVNGSTVTGGDNLGARKNIDIVNFNYSFCDGDDLHYFTVPSLAADYPYASELIEINSGSCNTVTPEACNLFLTFVSRSEPTTIGGTDGEITVLGYTSRTNIEYALSSFSFGDGTWPK